MTHRAIMAATFYFLLVIGQANAYPRFNGGCQYFEVEKSYEKSDLVFVGLLIRNEPNNSEPIDKSNPPQTILQENPPVRLSKNLTFRVMGILKEGREESSQWEQNVHGKFFTVRERYTGYSESNFQIGNTYLIFLSRKNNWGDDGWRIQECVAYEDLGKGDAYFVMKELEGKHALKQEDASLNKKTKSVKPEFNENLTYYK